MKRKVNTSIAIGVAAGVMYGSWAAWANWGHGLAWLRAAVAQFVLSFFSTALLTLAINRVLARGRSPANRLVAATVPLAIAITSFALLHWLLGTPQIAATIAPSAAIGLVFCIVYTRTQ
jgi:hypothetical protein